MSNVTASEDQQVEENTMLSIKLVSDKYRPTYSFTGINNGVIIKTTNPDGTIVDRLIDDKEFGEELKHLLKNGYNVEVR